MDRLEKLIGSEGNRAASIDTSVIDKDSRTVDVAFSSEAPVNRGWMIEILDHGPGAVRLDRIRNSGPLLADHEDERHIGVVQSAEISGDRRGRARVRFSKRDEADGIFQDVADGIRPHVSVRYVIHAARQEGEQDGVPVIRITDWEPLEISSVAVPADHTVGVGRSHKQPLPNRTTTMEPEVTTTKPAAPAAQPLNLEAERTAVRQAELDRVKSINAIGEKFGASELARQFIDAGKSADEFRSELLTKMDSKHSEPVRERSNKEIGMTAKEVKRFSFVRALNALANPTDKNAQEAAAFEWEASRAAAQVSGKSPKGILVPVDVLARAMSTDSTGAAGTNPSTAGLTIETTKLVGSFIDILRSKSLMAGMGTTLTGLIGNVEIPKQISEAAAVWIGEDGDAGETDIEFGQISMSPKTLGAYTEVTRRLLMQSSMDVESMVRRELAASLAKAIDIATLYGTGANNQPKGIKLQDGIGSVTFAGVQPTYAELVAMETAIQAADADVGSMSYILRPETVGNCKVTARGNGQTAPILEGNTLNGYGYKVTNRVSRTGTPATTMDVWFGNWADVLIGLWGGVDLLVDPYTHSLKGRMRVVVHQDCDINMRHAESFVLGKK